MPSNDRESNLETTVTRKGQITILAELRKKYGIREGRKVLVTDSPSGLLLKPIPHMNDWAGADAGKYTYAEMRRKAGLAQEQIALVGCVHISIRKGSVHYLDGLWLLF